MNSCPSIIVKKYGDTKTIWISEDYLCEKTSVTQEYLRTKCRFIFKKKLPPSQVSATIKKGLCPPDTGKSWRWTRIDGYFYYDLERIPNKSPNFYREKLGYEIVDQSLYPQLTKEVWEAIKIRLIEESKTAFRLERQHAIAYYIDNYNVDYKEAETMAQAFVWWRLISQYKENYILLGLEKVGQVFILISEILPTQKLPSLGITNPNSLRNRLKNFNFHAPLEEQWDFVLHKNTGNQNAKTHSEILKAMIITLRGKGYNWSADFICRKIWSICDKENWKRPSESWIDGVLTSKATKLLTEQSRFGNEGRLRRLTNGYIPIASPLFAGDCWQMDGTRINMIPHIIEKDGKKTEVFLFIVVVIDVYSKAILGWAYGYNEGHILYANALQMAVENCGYLPARLVHDRFPGYNKDKWVKFSEVLKERYQTEIIITHHAQGKSQVERFFGTFQSVFMSNTLWYYGEGIRSTRRYAHRSEQQLKEIKKIAKQIGWNYDKACDAVDNLLETYNQTPLCQYSKRYKAVKESPNQLLKESDASNTIALDKSQEAWLFHHQKTLQIGAGGIIKTSINDTPIHYRIEDYATLKTYDKIILSYDQRDLSTAKIYTLKGRFLEEVKELEPVQIFNPKLKGEKGRLSKERAKNKSLQRHFQEEYETISATVVDELAMLMPHTASKHQLEQAQTRLLGEFHPETLNIESEISAELSEEEMKLNFKRQMSGQ